MPTTDKEQAVKIVKLVAGIEGVPHTTTYGTADREYLLCERFDGIYTWRVLQRNERGGYTEIARANTLREAKAKVPA